MSVAGIKSPPNLCTILTQVGSTDSHHEESTKNSSTAAQRTEASSEKPPTHMSGLVLRIVLTITHSAAGKRLSAESATGSQRSSNPRRSSVLPQKFRWQRHVLPQAADRLPWTQLSAKTSNGIISVMRWTPRTTVCRPWPLRHSGCGAIGRRQQHRSTTRVLQSRSVGKRPCPFLWLKVACRPNGTA